MMKDLSIMDLAASVESIEFILAVTFVAQ